MPFANGFDFVGLREVVRVALLRSFALPPLEAAAARRFDFEFVIGISFGSAAFLCRHHRSPTSALKPAGQDPDTLKRSELRTVPLQSNKKASHF